MKKQKFPTRKVAALSSALLRGDVTCRGSIQCISLSKDICDLVWLHSCACTVVMSYCTDQSRWMKTVAWKKPRRIWWCWRETLRASDQYHWVLFCCLAVPPSYCLHSETDEFIKNLATISNKGSLIFWQFHTKRSFYIPLSVSCPLSLTVLLQLRTAKDDL